METYPKELIEGVSPLIFVVDAILNPQTVNDAKNKNNNVNSETDLVRRKQAFHSFFEQITSLKKNNNDKNGGGGGGGVIPSEMTNLQNVATQQQQQQKLLDDDPLAAILAIDPQTIGTETTQNNNNNTTISNQDTTTTTTIPLLLSGRRQQRTKVSSTKKLKSSITASTSSTSDKKFHPNNNLDFFTHANVVPVSHRHAFPPSKDPKGNNNAISRLNSNLTKRGGLNSSNHGNSGTSSALSTAATVAITKRTMIQDEIYSTIGGILPSGWMEKHLYALPSTLLLVTILDLKQVQGSMYEQARLEQHLANTLETLRSSCAKKRDCPVHLVCLILEDDDGKTGLDSGSGSSGSTDALEHERLTSIKTVCRLTSSSVTAIHTRLKKNNDGSGSGSETAATTPSSIGEAVYRKEEIHKLQKAVQEASLSYYLTQVRRCKKKHSQLHLKKFTDLLPVAARYCVKIAVFYEFQAIWDKERGEKSTKYWNEAYTNILEYYQYLQGSRRAGNVQSNLSDRMSNQEVDDYLHSTSNTESLTVSISGEVELQSNEQGENRNYSSLEDADQPPPPPPPTSQGDGVEVALVYSPKSGSGNISIGAKSPPPPSRNKKNDDDIVISSEPNQAFQTYSTDMIHQCRQVADWLNVKLLLLHYVTALQPEKLAENDVTPDKNTKSKSKTKARDGYSAVAYQISRHSKVFLSIPWTLNNNEGSEWEIDNGKFKDPIWHFWQYVAHQRLVLLQLTEHFPLPPNTNMKLSEEELYHCKASCQSAAAGESLLKLKNAVDRELQRMGGKTPNQDGSDFLMHVLKRAVSTSSENDKKQRFVGGFGTVDLIGKFQEEADRDHYGLSLDVLMRAVESLTKDRDGSSSKGNYAQSVLRLHFLIGGILKKKGRFSEAIERLEIVLEHSKKFPSIQLAVQKVLLDCRKSLGNGEGKPEVHAQVIKSSLAIVLNPDIHSQIEREEANTIIQHAFSKVSETSIGTYDWPNNSKNAQPFEFAVTFPGNTFATEGDEVPVTILLRSKVNTPVYVKRLSLDMNIGTVVVSDFGGSVVIFPEKTSKFSGTMCIPNDVNKNVDPKVRQQYNVKVLKPTTAGLTRLGGGVYETLQDDGVSQSPKKLQLGGLSIFCLSLQCHLSLLKESDSIIVKLDNHYGSKHFAQIQNGKTSAMNKLLIEEEFNIHSAWDRPCSLPLSYGPRCLRILSPQPDLEITDLTSTETKGLAMDGTVNRVILKLKAGTTEVCSDLKMRITCSNSMVDPNGKSVEMSKETSLIDAEDQNISNEQPSRAPILVQETGDQHDIGDKASNLPLGWQPRSCAGSDGAADDEWIPIVNELQNGKTVFTYLDFYRTLSEDQVGIVDRNAGLVCRTTFHVTISYKQSRSNQPKSIGGDELVSLDYSSSLIWLTPLKSETSILEGKRKSYPSGSRHPSNMVTNMNTAIEAEAIQDNEAVNIRCTLEAQQPKHGLGIRINEVKFEASGMEGCDITLVKAKGDKLRHNILFSPKPDDVSHILQYGSKMSIPYTVRPKMKPVHEQLGTVHYQTTRLGAALVGWTPLSIDIPEGVKFKTNHKFDQYHGPLPIPICHPVKLYGPVCYIEATPFEASAQIIPSIPKAATPFEVRYTVRNNTNLHQKIRITMNEGRGYNSTSTDGVLVSGLMNGDVNLGPSEIKDFSYFLLTTKVGKVNLPTVSVSSFRYSTWVICGSEDEKIFVTP